MVPWVVVIGAWAFLGWLLPILVYMPLLPCGPGKAAQVSIVRVLLSGFLYSLIIGVLSVVLAGVQISSRRESTHAPPAATGAPFPLSVASRGLL